MHRALVLVFTVLLLLAVGCGGSDGNDGAGDSADSAADPGGGTADVQAVADCLDAAGYPVETSALLTAEQEAAFGIDEVLGFDFGANGFLGSITFYTNADDAQESVDALAPMAEAAEAAGENIAERHGLAVIDLTGATTEAVAAARTCLQA